MIRNVVLDLGAQVLRAVVVSDGTNYEVAYRWWVKDPDDVPPVSWHKAVYGEVDYQRGELLKKKMGKPTLP